jgi:ubiquinone/menaquinone biosynthesis C-methylase UbiE
MKQEQPLPKIDSVKQEIQNHWEYFYKNSPGSIWPTETEKKEMKKVFVGIIGNAKKKVLDVGTGDGIIASLFAEMGHDVTGIDISKTALEKASKNAEQRNLQIQFKVAYAEAIPFPNDTFDLVICRVVFWTLPHPERALHEWVRILKPTGKIAIIDRPSFRGWRRIIYDIIWAFHRFNVTHTVKLFVASEYSEKTKKEIPFFQKGVTPEEIREYLSNLPVSEIRIEPYLSAANKQQAALNNPRMRKYWWYLKYIQTDAFIATCRVRK